jgi:hypothetical protein
LSQLFTGNGGDGLGEAVGFRAFDVQTMGRRSIESDYGAGSIRRTAPCFWSVNT